MALLAQRILGGLTPARWSRTRPPATESTPDRILMGIRPGHEDKGLPPVRIYLGSERHQFRAERAFLWSVEKHRDPGRVYEIYLMRDLRGFSRGFWLTGFTNYRFAIPAFCRFEGRAIYNDADQIYLTDPAELFDLEMAEAGFLSINDRDTSVMLIDCAKMKDVWTETAVRKKSRKKLEADARAQSLWGDLDNHWNARDKEYVPGAAKLVHFTTLHTQPWTPFPDQLIYFPNPTGQLWPDLEADANEHDFLPFNATRPSRHWSSVALYLTSKKTSSFWQPYLAPNPPKSLVPSIEISGLFEHVPDQDVLWVLLRLLKSTNSLKLRIEEPWHHGRGRFKRSLRFWLEHLTLASEMCPQTRWQLTYRSQPLSELSTHHGGTALEGDVTYLWHKKPGHNAQAQALAENIALTLNRSSHCLPISISEVSFVLGQLIGRRVLKPLPENTTALVAAGWLGTRLARAYQKRYPYLRLVLLGRKAGPAPIDGGVVVQCAHYGLPPDPRRITTLVPLNSGKVPDCSEKATYQAWRNSANRTAVLLGGSTKSYAYTEEDINCLASRLSEIHDHAGSSILVIGSRRSGAFLKSIKEKLPRDSFIYTWKPNDPANPYALALQESNHLIVTGDSESMIADALAQGRRFSIFFCPHEPTRRFDRFSKWVGQRAVSPTYNRRGSIRPQQGMQYLCARALERAWILPPRDLASLHETLYSADYAEPLASNQIHQLKTYRAPAVLEETTALVIEKLKLTAQESP